MDDSFVVSIPKAAIQDTNWDADALRSLILREAAVALYRQFDVSLGYCSQIPRMPIEDFISLLGAHQVSIFGCLTEEELKRDIENA